MDNHQAASELTYRQIKQFWYYRMGDKTIRIPTLDEWLDQFIGTAKAKAYPNLKLLYFDVKVPKGRY